MTSQSQPPIPPAAGLYGTPGSPSSPVSAFSADSAPSADSGQDHGPSQEGVITIQDTEVIDATGTGSTGSTSGDPSDGTLARGAHDVTEADPLGDGSFDAGRTTNPLADGGYGAGGDTSGSAAQSGTGVGATTDSAPARDFNAGGTDDSAARGTNYGAGMSGGATAVGASDLGGGRDLGRGRTDVGESGSVDRDVPVEPIPPVTDPADDPVVAAAAEEQGVAPAEATDDPEYHATDHDGDRLHDPRV